MTRLRSGPGRALALVGALLVVAAASYRLSSDQQAGAFGHLLIGVSSGSMAPRISAGDLEVERKVSAGQAGNLHPGQIISFRSPTGDHRITTSRIVAVVAAADGAVAYMTKTDANGTPAIAPREAVIGVSQSTIPFGWYVVDALHRPLPIGLILILVLVWLVSEPFRRRSREAAEAAHQELAFEDRTPVLARPPEPATRGGPATSGGRPTRQPGRPGTRDRRPVRQA